MNRLLLLLSFIFLYASSPAQDTARRLQAVRTNTLIKIDGLPDEQAWKNASTFSDFIEMRPSFGAKENADTRTEVWLLYDDNAIYVAGFCHEKNKDSISTELVGRDAIGVNDFVGIMFDTYSDKINGVGFYVTALGEQYDAKYSLGNEDESWSTVYQTATKINDGGWSFEMRIPYAALRFSKNSIQNWGVNVVRKRNKIGKQVSWSPIDPNKFGTMNQAGMLTSIENIKAPVRLSFSPYFSTYVNHVPNSISKKNVTASVNGGMDVKYGLSKGFTLDMTLIPDFGQVQSDNQVLNLTPFEVRFNENRSFFTEGTELFNKGNLFYSRRIGGTPINLSKPYSLTDSSETILSNPSETKLINATKLSGRTASGLGIGVFNAVTKPQFATIKNNNTNAAYEIETSPLTNYSIVVLDQTMKNNSSVSLVNTNVIRSGSTYDANVTAGLFDLYDKKVNWNVWGKVANSILTGYNQGKDQSGLLYEINLGKFRGPFNFEVHYYASDEQYQQNDLGYFTNNNYSNYGFSTWYKIIKPKHFYNNINFSLGGTYSELFSPRRYQYKTLNFRVNSQLKNLWSLGLRAEGTGKQQDFYEARMPGKMFRRPGNTSIGFFVNSNSAKKYAIAIDANVAHIYQFDGKRVDLYISNRYRFNDKLTVSLSNFNALATNDLGFAFIQADSAIFGVRERTTVENILNVKYNFNNKMGINFRTRHYWSKVIYDRFLLLQQNGHLKPEANISRNASRNESYFNIDMVYTWQFALGSFINIGWKDFSRLANQQTSGRYYKNLGETLGSAQENNFSVKVIYFLDYLSLKKTKTNVKE